MEANKPRSFIDFLPTAAVLSVVGWGGLAAVILFTLPTLGPRWLFFCLGVMALSGTSLPVIYFFHVRFPSQPPVEPGVILRQSIWVGVYGSTLAWLQLGRVLTPVWAAVLALILIVVESLLRLRERSRWKPQA